MNIFKSSDFKKMPWKNGGGETTELYLISKGDSFLFRLSMASVKSNGPFSSFPGMSRILLLLEGNGLELKGPHYQITMDNITPFSFQGEDPIECTLIDGPCLDFNVMTNRDFAKSTISLVELTQNETRNLTSACDLTLLYDKEEEKLYELKGSAVLHFKAVTPKRLIRVDVTFV
ncbi:MAG: HutD family protein [Bdellovibrionales bacterium]|nr:HutD family protein [Bdellovibrionales bacterium]